MAKTKITTSERSVKSCFIEIRGKASFKSTITSNTINDQGDRSPILSNIKDTLSTIKNNDCQTSKTSSYNIAGIKEETSNNTDDSENSQISGKQKRQEKDNEHETVDDDKSDYGAESFCSADSCKVSDVTNVTPRSSLSDCSSLLHSAGLNYDKRITDLMKSRRSEDRRRDEEEDVERFSLLENEMKYLSEEEGTLMIDRRQLSRSGRRNMSFTNEELRKIERENQLLLKKIMSHQKPQNKSAKPVSGAPRTSSSAINRKRLQKKIEEDNMILLRRIQQAKPCAMPKTLTPSCKLAMM